MPSALRPEGLPQAHSFVLLDVGKVNSCTYLLIWVWYRLDRRPLIESAPHRQLYSIKVRLLFYRVPVDISIVYGIQDMVYGIINNLYIVLSGLVPEFRFQFPIPYIKVRHDKTRIRLDIIHDKG